MSTHSSKASIISKPILRIFSCFTVGWSQKSLSTTTTNCYCCRCIPSGIRVMQCAKCLLAVTLAIASHQHHHGALGFVVRAPPGTIGIAARRSPTAAIVLGPHRHLQERCVSCCRLTAQCAVSDGDCGVAVCGLSCWVWLLGAVWERKSGI